MHLSSTPHFFGLTAPLLGMVTLAAGLWAVPAGASTPGQTLNGTDTLTVSGTGTVGIQSGQAVSNTVSSYSVYSTVNGATVTTNGASAFTLQSGGTISNAKLGGGYGLYDLSSGTITITGGSITAGQYGTGFYDLGGGPIAISGGSISGGQNGYGMYASGNGAVTITSGTFSAGQYGYGLDSVGRAAVTVSGGTFTGGQAGYGLDANGTGAVTITGGVFSAGQGGYGLDADHGTINLFSLGDSAFLIDGVAMNNTVLSSSAYQSGHDTISGTLANGDMLNTTFADYAGKLNLNPGITPPASAAPEPSGLALWAFVGLSAGGLVLKAKKRKMAA